MGLADNAARAAAKAKTKYPSYGSLPSYVQSAISQRGARESVANQTAIPTKPNFLPKTVATPPNKYEAQVTTTNAAPSKTTTTTTAPVQTTPAPAGPVQVTEPTPEPAQQEAAPAPEWTLEGDPFYQQAIADAQAQFNLERINALGTKQYQEVGTNRQLEERKGTAESARRRLAGNYAARGMAGGGYGALSRAEAEQNARELTARTGLREQLSELNRQFVGQYGAEGSDWLGTLRGQQARDTASNLALQNRLAGVTTVG